ncbi:hypothetical protein [Thiomicrospira sp. WB1]|uniref:hypothetical protein n=1 Tax=Thiomicrospira sp. WB1 TaxID=1685380 RepID=UPI00074AE85A|nr:hypothetical protein [Thiomicrospira sp. WB1]KUJ72890.1 hypothetical protein AVO41_03675 [Thiomicrospira sp. WB1]
MVRSYQDLHAIVQQAQSEYSKEHTEASIAFDVPDDMPEGACALANSDNRKKAVFILARFGEEYKVGYALYEPDELSKLQPVHLADVNHDEFDAAFVIHLIDEFLVE